MDECKRGVARATGRPGAVVASGGRTGSKWWLCQYIWRDLFRKNCPARLSCVNCDPDLLMTTPRRGEDSCWVQAIISINLDIPPLHRLERLLDWQHQMNLLHQGLTLEDTRHCKPFFSLSAVTAHEYIMDIFNVNYFVDCSIWVFCVSLAHTQ